jgi:hypothetical protein
MKSVQFLRALAVLARRRRKRLLVRTSNAQSMFCITCVTKGNGAECLYIWWCVQDQGKRLKAHGYRTAKLARRVLTAWKQMVQKAKSDR